MSTSTSRSLGVSPRICTGVGSPGSGRAARSSSSRRATAGSSHASPAATARIADDPPPAPYRPVSLVRDDASRHHPAHLTRLAWHAYALDGRLAFPGDTLLRISTDLAAGGAGILSAMHAALHHTGVTLPFLDAPTHVATTGHLLAAS
ncbi:hypothetical protein [Micromonospora sp. AB353]|uniref:hypothetical protein n=1 Tax=Micromonospora sp. AB353 TaxID=3413282 RepID=UPI003C2486DF